jgi:hypothetical protein
LALGREFLNGSYSLFEQFCHANNILLLAFVYIPPRDVATCRE